MDFTNFDLDINNYNINDFEKLFKLSPSSKYSANDIEYKEYQLREQLFRSGQINKQIRPNLVQFLHLAKTRLIQVKCVPAKKPSVMSDNWQLDTGKPILNAIEQKEMQRETELIIKPKASYTYTQNSDYFQGILNPLEKRVITRSISIDSLFRNNYGTTVSSDYIYTLPESLNNITSMKLTALELANSWPMISSKTGTNYMSIDVFGDDVGVPNKHYNVVIPDGNYLSSNFVFLLSVLFKKITNSTTTDTLNNNNNNHGTTIANGGLNYIVPYINEYSTKTNFFIRGDAPNGFGFTIDFTAINPTNMLSNSEQSNQVPLNKTLGWILGFREPTYTIMFDDRITGNNPHLINIPPYTISGKQYNMTGNIYNAPINYYISDALTNIVPPSGLSTGYGSIIFGQVCSEGSYGSLVDNYIFLDVDDYHNNFTTNTIMSVNRPNQSYLGTNILARISVTVGQNITMTDTAHDNICKKREYFGPVKLEKLHIRLLNRFGDTLDITNNDYSLLLEFTQLYS